MPDKNMIGAVAALGQEIKDFKNEVISDIREIKIQTKFTNGKVAEAIKEIAILKEKQKSCPARIFYYNPNMKDLKDWSLKKSAIVISLIIAVVITGTQLVIAYMKP